MKRLRTVGGILTAALLLLIALSSIASAREKIVVAVVPFADETNKKLGGKATDVVTNTFVELKYFRVVERGRLDQLMREIAHQQTGFVDDKTAVQIGNQLGAQAIVLGSVSSAGYNVVQNQWKDDKGNVHISYTAKANVTLNVRIVQVETGEIVFAEAINGYASDTVSAGSQPQPEDVLIDKAVQNAAYNLYRPVQEKFPLTGYVIKIEGQIIWVDFGSSWGIKNFRKVTIYREGEPIVHPKTGKVIGRNREVIAKDRVSETMEEMCKVKLSKKEAERVQVGDVVVAEPEGFLLH